jgi:hypothetical protein
MPNVTMTAPNGITQITAGNYTYPVVNGGVTVPAEFSSELLDAGFTPQILSTDANGNPVLLGPDGVSYAISDYAAVLFANLPDPTKVQAGVHYYVSDVGVGGSQWYSDGTRWRALGGTVVLKNNYTDVTSVANTNEQILDQFLFKANLIKAGDIIRVKSRYDKSSTVDTCSRRFRIGTAGDVGDMQIALIAQPATSNRSLHDLREFVFNTATSIRNLTSTVPTGYALSTAAAADTAIPSISNALYMTVTTQMTTGAETMTLKDFIIELDTCGN